MNKNDKIVVTGAAGLVGQNLVLLLCEQGYTNILAIDKHRENLELLKKLNSTVTTMFADLAEKGGWQNQFEDCQCAIMLHAQITSLHSEDFIRNNITATEKIVDAIKQFNVAYTVHISSSVVNSVADDNYTRTKIAQEKFVIASGIKHCVLRPTLMYGWFDPKHLGWLSRFMARAPIFPIPGDGKYLRQPLYSRDFCRIIIAAIEQQPDAEIFDIVGTEEIDYIDMIREIKKAKKLKTAIVKIPYWLFYSLLKTFSLFNKKPPFTTDQLKALTAGDYFQGSDYEKKFGVAPTSFSAAIDETFNHPEYSSIVVKR